MPHMNRLSSYQTTIANDGKFTIVTYHKTQIVKWDDESIILNFGGYDTVTTRRKMNQASRQFGLGYSVFRHKGQTYINSTNDLDPSQSAQYTGHAIVIGRANRGYGRASD